MAVISLDRTTHHVTDVTTRFLFLSFFFPSSLTATRFSLPTCAHACVDDCVCELGLLYLECGRDINQRIQTQTSFQYPAGLGFLGRQTRWGRARLDEVTFWNGTLLKRTCMYSRAQPHASGKEITFLVGVSPAEARVTADDNLRFNKFVI